MFSSRYLLASLTLTLLTPWTSGAALAKSRWTFYDMPTPLAGPCDLCTGPDNAIWAQDILANKIARIDPITGQVDEYTIPFTLPALSNTSLPNIGGRVVFACAIRPGADGHVYAANGIRNQLVRVNVTSRVIDVFTPPPFNPLGDLQPFNDLYAGATGMFFTQTTANVITHFDYVTHEFINYPVPTPEGSPLGMFVSHDGYAWFAELLGQKIGRLNATTGVIKEYPLPLSLAGPAVIRVELNKKQICFTAFIGNAIGCLNEKTGAVTVYPNTASPLVPAFPAEDTLDGNGHIWFSTATQNTLNRLNPSNGNVTTVTYPGTFVVQPVSLPFYFNIAITYYTSGNAIYFTEATTNRVGRYQL